ncbi:MULTISPECIES: HAD family hydrolase [Paenibacillus]|jgi:HAD superfamily hydrolase (TIGR01549 family)|uniref:HAD family hydrolase n=1 Tax=Paenibacillus TaxID=44249 RepID=UPI00096C9C79|nr:HAD family hydrolase [Paenibacillus odorifer]OME04431.1 HAD family hydrolase [Paenibacillus odorifer]
MRNYNTVIFDVDGTLIDTEIAVLSSLQKMLKVDHNREYELSELYFVLGIPGSASLPQLGIEDIHEGNERWNVFMKDFYDTINIFDGIVDVMSSLQSKEIVQGIVTSKTRDELNDDFVPFGLTKYLSYTVIAEDTAKHKPHPDPLLEFIRVSKANPESSIYIGDTIYDYECARDAGVDFGLALWGCKQHEHIPAKYKFETPQDILKLQL